MRGQAQTKKIPLSVTYLETFDFSLGKEIDFMASREKLARIILDNIINIGSVPIDFR